jgi:hypothetical protein
MSQAWAEEGMATATDDYLTVDADRRLRRLLELVHMEQLAVGTGVLPLEEVYFHLDRFAESELEVLPLSLDDARLERVLRAMPGWRAVVGGWRIEETDVTESIQQQRLRERRAEADAPVVATRRLRALVELLCEPAYARAELPWSCSSSPTCAPPSCSSWT